MTSLSRTAWKSNTLTWWPTRIQTVRYHVRMFAQKSGSRSRYAEWLNSLETHEDIVRELFVECPLLIPRSFCAAMSSNGSGL